MNWAQALQLILLHITRGMRLDGPNAYKIVTEVPPYPCNRNNFGGVDGFKVQVGANDFVDVPIFMLRDIHRFSRANGNLYNREVFRTYDEHLLRIKPCYVHVVGKIFLESKVATQINNRDYILL